MFERFQIWWTTFRQRWYWADQGHLMPRPGAVEEYKQPQYSRATTPAPWSDDITRHNASVSRAYKEEVLERQKAFSAGTYTPRFLLCDPLMKVANATGITIADVNWDLEMTLRPNARMNVTNQGAQLQLVTPQTRADIRVEGMAKRAVDAVANGQTLPSPRTVLGSRAAILEVCGGNEFLADQVEAQAREFFGVEDLDAPIAIKPIVDVPVAEYRQQFTDGGASAVDVQPSNADVQQRAR